MSNQHIYRPATIALFLAGAVALIALLFVLFVPLGSVEPAGEADAIRARCLRAAHERWNWETESGRLIALYEELASEIPS